MEITQWGRQTKVPTLLLTEVSHQMRSISIALVPYASVKYPKKTKQKTNDNKKHKQTKKQTEKQN